MALPAEPFTLCLFWGFHRGSNYSLFLLMGLPLSVCCSSSLAEGCPLQGPFGRLVLPFRLVASFLSTLNTTCLFGLRPRSTTPDPLGYFPFEAVGVRTSVDRGSELVSNGLSLDTQLLLGAGGRPFSFLTWLVALGALTYGSGLQPFLRWLAGPWVLPFDSERGHVAVTHGFTSSTLSSCSPEAFGILAGPSQAVGWGYYLLLSSGPQLIVSFTGRLCGDGTF